MKLMVAGARGQVALSLLEAGKRRKLNLVTRGRPDLDITDAGNIKRSMDREAADIVINAAAYTAVDRAEEEPDAAMALNHYGAGALAGVCHERGIPIVHLSTDYVFDGSKKTAYLEIDQTAPLGIYGRSKLAGERAVIAANPQYIIVRTAWVYSPFGNNFVKTMLRLAASRDELSVVDDQLGCPTYAPHIAEGLLDIAQALHSGAASNDPWGIYNMAGAGETSWCGFAREIFTRSIIGGGPVAQVHAISTAEYPTPAKRPANSRLDCSKLSMKFDVTLPHWREGTADCVARLLNVKERAS